MRMITFLIHALFALFAAAHTVHSDDDWGKGMTEKYPDDQQVGNYKNGVFIISSKCSRSCDVDCHDAKILETKAGVGPVLAQRLAEVLVGDCTHSDHSKGCGCRIPNDESCAKVYTCAEVEENSNSKVHAKCRPMPILSPPSYDRPCECPKTCKGNGDFGRTRLESLDLDRVSTVDPKDVVSFRTRLQQTGGIQPGHVDPKAVQLDGTPPMTVDGCHDKDKEKKNCG
ncbi:hypothetical protein IWX90DRAFT_412391 [Phyllosticta citrichinensis]|uniref:Uncharacterized protein n=1 Tax=Phyllosticta citrichinensis TaxID=1130410 RepID=A0ABR1Y3X7_9PEZI